MRKCPFNGCKASLPPHLFACGFHWYSLSKSQQQRIYASYDAYMSDEIDVNQLRSRQQAVLDETTIGGQANA